MLLAGRTYNEFGSSKSYKDKHMDNIDTISDTQWSHTAKYTTTPTVYTAYDSSNMPVGP